MVGENINGATVPILVDGVVGILTGSDTATLIIGGITRGVTVVTGVKVTVTVDGSLLVTTAGDSLTIEGDSLTISGDSLTTAGDSLATAGNSLTVSAELVTDVVDRRELCLASNAFFTINYYYMNSFLEGICLFNFIIDFRVIH